MAPFFPLVEQLPYTLTIQHYLKLVCSEDFSPQILKRTKVLTTNTVDMTTSIPSNRLVESLLASDPSIARFTRRSNRWLASDRSPLFLPAAFPAKTQATLPVTCRYSPIRLHDYERHDDQ
jgi:hypothetical protein